jgi:hypothetical protein
MHLSVEYVFLADLFVAYRKAKADAFFERTHPKALPFTHYEQSIEKNLRQLHRKLAKDI